VEAEPVTCYRSRRPGNYVGDSGHHIYSRNRCRQCQSGFLLLRAQIAQRRNAGIRSNRLCTRRSYRHADCQRFITRQTTGRYDPRRWSERVRLRLFRCDPRPAMSAGFTFTPGVEAANARMAGINDPLVGEGIIRAAIIAEQTPNTRPCCSTGLEPLSTCGYRV